MNKYYKRQKGLYGSFPEEPFRISRSAIGLFLECPRCFHLDKKLGLGRPGMPSWPLNSAVDQLPKNDLIS